MLGKIKRYSARELAVLTYENSVRANYLLLGIFAATVGTRFIGTPPLVVISYLVSFVALTLTLLILVAKIRHGVRIPLPLLAMVVTALGALTVLLFASWNVDGNLGNVAAVFRIGFAGSALWWALTTPLLERNLIDGDDVATP